MQTAYIDFYFREGGDCAPGSYDSREGNWCLWQLFTAYSIEQVRGTAMGTFRAAGGDAVLWDVRAEPDFYAARQGREGDRMTYCRKTWFGSSDIARASQQQSSIPMTMARCGQRTRSREQVARICAVCPVRLVSRRGTRRSLGHVGQAEPTTRREMTRSVSIDDVEHLQCREGSTPLRTRITRLKQDLFEKYRIRPGGSTPVTRFLRAPPVRLLHARQGDPVSMKSEGPASVAEAREADRKEVRRSGVGGK